MSRHNSKDTDSERSHHSCGKLHKRRSQVLHQHIQEEAPHAPHSLPALGLTCTNKAGAALALGEGEVVFVLGGFAALTGETDTGGEAWLVTSF